MVQFMWKMNIDNQSKNTFQVPIYSKQELKSYNLW